MTALVSPAAPVAVPHLAPLQIELRFIVKKPPHEVFALVSTRLAEWFTAIHAVTWDHARSTQPGAVGACSERTCDFAGKALLETIVEWEAGRWYAYRVEMDRSEMKMPLEDHLGSFEVNPVDGGSLVTWRQHFRPKWFVPGFMLRWQMGQRMMRPAVERLFQQHGGEWAR